MNSPATCFASILLLTLGVGAALGQTAPPPTVLYQLGDESSFEAGCLPPCLCPVSVRSGLSGGMNLTLSGFDGVFRHYDVGNVDWLLGDVQTAPVHVTGSGHYRVAGDQQQLTLDLSVGGKPAQRYDSGLTGGGSSFPELRLPIALHGFFCHDSVYGVQATSTVVGVIGPPTSSFELRVGPNPFQSHAAIAFSLAARGAVELRIHDLAGREVRTLLDGGTLDAGPHSVTWDGVRKDGGDAPPGIYFVRLKTAGRELGGTLVKL